MKYFYTLLLTIVLLYPALGQVADQNARANYFNGDFIGIGGQATRLELKDEGVSPLFYDGNLPGVGMDWLSRTDKDEFYIFGTYAYGNLSRETSLDIFFSSVHNINHGGHYLRQAWKAPQKDIYLKVGGHYQGITNVRDNPDFRNASNTVESINSLGISAKVEWLFDRNKSNRKLFWLLPLKPGRRVSSLSYQLNVPVFNLVWSPVFIYLDDFTEGNIDYEQKNEFTSGGFRLNSTLAYEYFLKNGNSFRLQYFWEVYKGNNGRSTISYGQHQLQLGMHIRLSELSTSSQN